jgi:photosystem II stability/assembly factor-like uncharacterized protein
LYPSFFIIFPDSSIYSRDELIQIKYFYKTLLTFVRFNSKIRHVSNEHNKRIARLLISSTIVTIILLLSFITIPPTQTFAATPEALKWTKVNIPAEGTSGSWVLASGSDIHHLTIAADGTLYAYVKGLTYTLYKSTDGGLRWNNIGNVQDAITGIAVSPHDAKIIYYATASSVYRSGDGGKSFILMPTVPAGVGANITSIAMTWLNSNIIAVGTADADASKFGGVYVLDEGDIFSNWLDTDVGNYDIYALGFTPDYTVGRQIVAVATNETDTFVINKIGNADWNAFIGSARLNKNNSVIPASVAANRAIIAFPGNYDTDTSSRNSFFFVGITTGNGGGDIYKIVNADAPDNSKATDLNCGGAYGTTNADITGLTVYSDERNVILLAGSTTNCHIYISKDGGSSWIKSKKEPTGGSDTEVLMAPDFANTGIIYAATSGDGSALSISRDMGSSWNQISLIDTAINNIVDFAPSLDASQINTLFMITAYMGQRHAFWRSINNGSTWERILCSNYPGVDILGLVSLPPQYSTDCLTLFVYGESNGKPAIWESKDNGQSFRSWFTRDPATGAAFNIDVWAAANENTIYTGSFNGSQGMIYRTTNSGYSYSAGATAGAYQLNSLALSPDFENDDTILVGNEMGGVYLSTDNGSSFQSLPADAISPPLDGEISVVFDPEFKSNHTVYAASNDADGGIYRFIIGSSDSWEEIDDTLPAGALINRLVFSSSGVLYAANKNPDGGMERCINPRFSLGPVFETVTRGLSDSVTLTGLWQGNRQLWSVDFNSVNLITYYDPLTLPTTQVLPENKVSGIGSLVNHTVRNITLDWETLGGATSYEWQCNYNTDFSTIPDGLNGTTSASSVRLPALEPATTYYWRVRACAPVLSPWSLKRSFTTSMDTESVNLKPETPSPGASGVAIKPVFQWTAVLGAEAYELLVATDADLNHPVIVKINEYALKTNAWDCDVSLDYNTVYYWKIRATTATTYSAWSSVGIFTTETVPPAENESPTPIPTPTPSITQKLLATLSLPTIFTPTSPLLAPSAPASSPAVNQLLDMPVWMIYFIGGLFGIVFLALIIVLVIVIKIKRI